ncbi:putative transcriptional regulator [Schinkia azotoformans MEV2011]|uniref:Putative transcriptional regulator n=1 Tax=Schinkia azotoformans MEV2011 TaxID=1348973 RepID=A0A072NHI0_SCHAZ|nr:helix-turn-helix transcriptional regulator [Schinkia azotoformans]KEF37129.1 putative transcriptional regulator [Schinkia azotoformans MEV2011]MEC1694344.1 helix-turn-helix transcriptional regulator [Schinkia azotoformans]MEC1718458.1 helix-turn-helix transcriptional regulator [Schinkia azotoformans]MEC1723373.1 helix-turn-helix transcriptional regulator [Schinkia azotoformans]MEC1743283.1 helix-turn-helix transcriptional regulator [Schinkia azotoformans]
MNKLATNIKFFREQEALTQKELADKLGVSRSVVAKWENETVSPDLETLITLSKYFQVSLDHLVGLPYFQNEMLLELNQIYKTNDESNIKLFGVVDYLYKNTKLQECLLKFIELPLKDRRIIEKIFNVAVDEFCKRK